MPLRTRAVQGDQTAAAHHGLPLQGLPADEFERVLAERRDPRRRIRGHTGRAGDRRAARRVETLFLRVLHELDVHAAGRHRLVRQHPPDHARRRKLVDAFHGDMDRREAALGDHGRRAQLRGAAADGRL